MKHRAFVLIVACALGSPGVVDAQPFAWLAGSTALDVVNLATGTTVMSANAPAGVQVGDGAIDPSSGDYFAITNIGTFRVRLSGTALQPAMLPYTGHKLRFDPTGATLMACSGSSPSMECRWIRRSDDALRATYSNVWDIRFAPDGSLVLLTRLTATSGPFTLRRFVASDPGTAVWTINVGNALPSVRVGSTRFAASNTETFGNHRIQIFDTTTGVSAGELPFYLVGSIHVVGGRLYVTHSTSASTLEAYRFARFNLDTLELELDVQRIAVVGNHLSMNASADGQLMYVQSVALVSRITASFSIETYDATTLQLLHVRATGERFSMAVSADPVCPFIIAPAPFASPVTAPARGGVVEFRVTTEARCGPWSAQVTGGINAVGSLLGPMIRQGSDTVHLVFAPRVHNQLSSIIVRVAGNGYQIDQLRESSVPAAPINVRAHIVGNTPTISWSFDDGPLTTDVLILAGTEGGPPTVNEQLPATMRSWSPGSLPPGNYFVQLRALNDIGSSALSGPVLFSIGASQPPGPPQDLRADVRGTYVRLVWNGPSTQPFATRYVVEAAPSGGPRSIVAQISDTSREFSLGSAPTGTWDIGVRAVNDAGISASSNAVTVTTTPCSAAPNPPGNFRAIITGNILTMAWDLPPRGADAFILEAGSMVGASDLARLTLPASTTRLDAPAPSGAYALRVRGVNQCGEGAASSERIIYVR